MRYLPERSTRRAALEYVPVEGPPRRFSFSVLNRLTQRFASLLHRSGIQPGDRVGLYLPNSPELVIALFGNHLLGAVTVPINPAAVPKELDYIAAKAEVSAFISESVLSRRLKVRLRPSEFESALSEADRDFPENRDLESPALLCFTSGTTARPKGVLLSHRNIRSNLTDLIQTWEWSAADHLLLSLPLFHVHGLGIGLHGWALTGCRATVLEKFDPGRVLEILKRKRCSLFMGVPTMYRRIVDACDRRRHGRVRLRLAVTGSAPMSMELHQACRELFGFTLLERYGMTETMMNTSNPYRGTRKPGSVGLPLPSVEVKLIDEQGRQVGGAGAAGEVCVRGRNVFAEYWKDPAATRQAFAGGWFRTGDLASRDEDGYYYLLGRVALDWIKSSGYRVGAREVEEVLERHPAVREAAVVGLPDPQLGERVVAFVAVSGPTREEELLAFCRESLARYKCPREIRFLPVLPRNALGKVQKTNLTTEGTKGTEFF